MTLPEYVTKDEVKRVCKALGLRDWTKLKKPDVPMREAEVLLPIVNVGKMKIDMEQFRKGLEVELEHGIAFAAYNVTNNHPVLTAKIVMAHFQETLDYYTLLDVAELEGDLVKAIKAKNLEKVTAKFKKLAEAKATLGVAELNRLR